MPFDFCVPTIKVATELVPCVDFKGRENHVLLMHVEPSMEVHANQADEVFMRIGDKSKRLTFDERMQLMYDKGDRFFEDKPVPDARLDDLDLDFVQEYIRKIGYRKSPLEYLTENKGFIRVTNGKQQISTAAILLFGKKPQERFFPKASIRFIRYDGIEELSGTEMNVIKDVIFEGNILKMVTDAIWYLDTQVKERTYLGKDGLFVTEEEYPKFVRQEIIVNAVTHRDYSIRGTDIQVKMFNDRIVVESPGRLPGLVKVDNIRHTHFSRNPKIAEFLRAYDFVKEYGEGVDRMCKELEAAGLQDPEYRISAFMLQTIIRNHKGIIYSDLQMEPTFVSETNRIYDTKKHCLIDGKATIENKKHCLDEENDKKALFETVEKAIAEKQITRIVGKNMKQILETFEKGQVFGRKEVKEKLGYGDSKAGKMLEAMLELEIVTTVEGKGKGKYTF